MACGNRAILIAPACRRFKPQDQVNRSSGAGHGERDTGGAGWGVFKPREEMSMEPSPIRRHRITHEAGVSTVWLGGELDMASAATVQGLLFEQIESPEVTEVRVDMAEVGFLDSSALRVLISGLNHANEQGRSFAVVNPSPAAQRILTVTGLDQVLVQS
jgi:anti-sigma B factor antagonist